MKEFDMNSSVYIALLTLLSLVSLVGAIVGIGVVASAGLETTMAFAIITVVFAFVGCVASRAQVGFDFLYLISAFFSLLTFIIFACSYDVADHQEVIIVLFLPIIDIVCFRLAIEWSSKIIVANDTIYFGNLIIKKWLVVQDIVSVRKGLFGRVVIRTAAGKIAAFVKNADECVNSVLNVRLGHESETLCE